MFLKNHLVIGLGGTGGKIIREFRKSLVEQYRTLEPDGVQLGYLYVDSDTSAMGSTDRKWRTLGHNVQLNKQSQLEIGAANLGAVLENVNAFPAVKGWIGDRAFWSTVLTLQAGATVLGQQKRRLGRFLFSQKAQEYVTRVKTIAGDLQMASGGAGVAFHVCCGLAGGTGSGCVLDAIAQIRSSYDDSRQFPVYIYALLPDRTPAHGWDTGNYHANGYAALLELNALHVGAWKPHDLAGVGRRLAFTDPFNTCFVFTNQNEKNTFINVDTEVPQVIASFLSASILTAHREQVDGFRRVVTAENVTDKITPEPKPDGTGAERSRKFGVFGIKRLEYPEEEIREYLAYAFARQAALQLVANNWRDLVGYVEEPRPNDFTELVRKPETQEKWKISLDHLMLSKGVLEGEIGDARWRPIGAFWNSMGPQWLAGVTGNEETRTKWMHELKARFEESFDIGYRAQGVREFYRGKLKAKRDHADEIIRTIERELMDGWLKGSGAMGFSLGEISKILAALRSVLQDQVERIERLETEDQARVKRTDQTLKANDVEWGKLGVLSRQFNRDKNILNAQTAVLQEKYAAMTRLESIGFAKALLLELGARVDDLSKEVSEVRKTVDEALQLCTRQMATRCAQTEDYDLNQLVVTFYNTRAVRELAAVLERDPDIQATQTRAVREAITTKMVAGDQATFAKFNARVRVDALVELLESVCQDAAELAHNEAITAAPGRKRLIGVNLVDKLDDEYAGRPDELKEFVESLVNKAGRYATFREDQQQQTGRGLCVGDPPTEYAVLLPESAERADFRERLAELFRGSSGSVPITVYPSSRQNEITLVSVSGGFPLRFLDDVRYLSERYLQRVETDARAKVEVHLEGDGTQYPPLFLPGRGVREEKTLTALIIADALQLVQQRKTGPSGKVRWVRILYDTDGDEVDKIDLGASIFDAAEQATEEIAYGLWHVVDERLESREFRSEERRVALRKELSERVGVMRDALGDSDEDLRTKLNVALQRAKARLQSEVVS